MLNVNHNPHRLRLPAAKSLRRSLVLYLMTACLLPLAIIGVITYITIYSILQNKIQNGINASLKQEAATLENTINNLDFASFGRRTRIQKKRCCMDGKGRRLFIPAIDASPDACLRACRFPGRIGRVDHRKMAGLERLWRGTSRHLQHG